MDFPVIFEVAGLRVPAHFVLEALAYAVGFQTYRVLRRRQGDHLAGGDRWTVIAAAAAGAALGSWLLGWLSDLEGLREVLRDPRLIMGRKTIVGGLLGGLLAVEWCKRRVGVTRSTGDLFALPLCVGMAVGRLGCISAGLADGTHGLATAAPWGLDFGDGVSRHPVRIYEILCLAVLAVGVTRLRPPREGDRFRLFMAGYLVFRLLVDFLKPGRPLLGLTAIQWAALAGVLYYARDMRRLVRRRDTEVFTE